MGIQLGIGLTGQRLNASPARLFSVTGSRGFMYDLSDYSTQFQDTAATVPITSTAQSLGLVLDQSQGLALGPELVTNGDFSSGTGWTTQSGWSISGGVLNGNVAPAAFTNAFSTVSLTAGKAYQVTYTITSYTSGSVRATFYTGTGVSGLARSSAGTFTELMIAGAGNTAAGFQGQGTGFVGIIDNITVRELAGNHATQGTAGNRPLTTTIGAGFRGIQFDGVDDWLSTAAIDFSNSDEVTVVAGVRKLSDAGRGVVVELGAPAASYFNIEAPNAALGNFVASSRGSALSSTGYAQASPSTQVFAMQAKISTDSLIIRGNGTQVATSAADQGTGNYANAIVYIGRRGGTTLPFNGVLTFLLVINRLLTANELASVEAYANQRTGAY